MSDTSIHQPIWLLKKVQKWHIIHVTNLEPVNPRHLKGACQYDYVAQISSSIAASVVMEKGSRRPRRMGSNLRLQACIEKY